MNQYDSQDEFESSKNNSVWQFMLTATCLLLIVILSYKGFNLSLEYFGLATAIITPSLIVILFIVGFKLLRRLSLKES